MKRFDRLFGILLYLRSRHSVAMSDLAEAFDVSVRTIHRDIETLSAAGVPIYTARGRTGGIGLVDGYFLPSLMFSEGEAVSILLGLSLLCSLEAIPFAAELESSRRKVLAVVPDPIRTTLDKIEKSICFEPVPYESCDPDPTDQTALNFVNTFWESQVLTSYVRAVLNEHAVRMQYPSPYNGRLTEMIVQPLGLFCDRRHWYMVGLTEDNPAEVNIWRSDRVKGIWASEVAMSQVIEFDIQTFLAHHGLKEIREEINLPETG